MKVELWIPAAKRDVVSVELEGIAIFLREAKPENGTIIGVIDLPDDVTVKVATTAQGAVCVS